MSGYTGPVAEFCSELTLAELPELVVAHVRLALADVLGCGLYGSTLPWSGTLLDAVSSFAGPGPAGVIGRPGGFSPDVAALLNGAMIHSFEFDDLHMESFLHPGATVVPAVLAAAAHAPHPVSGAEFVAALVAGYEIGIRVGLCAGLGLLRGGWHNSAVVGPLAAAAAAGRLLGLSPPLANQCLGAAATQAGGLVSAQYGSLVKRLHPGRAAQSGFYAAALVRRGYTGIEDVFDQQYGGFPATLTDDYDRDELLTGLGTQWRLVNTGFKLFPVSASCYTSVEAALWAHREQGIRAPDVDSVRVSCSLASLEHVGWPYVPGTTTTAQMNLRYAAAAALVDGFLDPERFTAARLRDPEVVSLAERIEAVADPEIDAGGRARRHAIRAEFRLVTGRTVSVQIERALGFGGAPVTAEQVHEKFRRNASAVLGDAGGDLHRMIMGVTELADVRRLTGAVTGLDPRPRDERDAATPGPDRGPGPDTSRRMADRDQRRQ